MRKLVVTSVAIACLSLPALAQETSLFDCLDKQTLSQDANCIAQKIENNQSMQSQIAQIDDSFEQQEVELLSVVTLYPDKQAITVVAYHHTDELID